MSMDMDVTERAIAFLDGGSDGTPGDEWVDNQWRGSGACRFACFRDPGFHDSTHDGCRPNWGLEAANHRKQILRNPALPGRRGADPWCGNDRSGFLSATLTGRDAYDGSARAASPDTCHDPEQVGDTGAPPCRRCS